MARQTELYSRAISHRYIYVGFAVGTLFKSALLLTSTQHAKHYDALWHSYSANTASLSSSYLTAIDLAIFLAKMNTQHSFDHLGD